MPQPVDLIIDVPQGGLPEARLRWIQQYSRQYEGGPMQLQMSRPKRTSKQNRYYWGGVIGEIRQGLVDMGQACSVVAIHQMMKERHLPVTYENVMGVELFARQKPPGWDVWGNQVESDLNLTA